MLLVNLTSPARGRFCDLVFENDDPNKGTYGRMELAMDLFNALFFTLGSLSVYNEDKGFAVPVLRMGLILPFFRCYHYANLVLGQNDWCTSVTAADHCPTLRQCSVAEMNDPQQINGYGHPICCSGYPCEWCGTDACASKYWNTAEARASGLATPQPHSCAAIKTADKCTSDGDIYLGEMIFWPQLLSGLFYCWLLSAYIKKKRAGLLAVNEDGSVPAAKPP